MTINPRRGTTMTKSEDGGAARTIALAAAGQVRDNEDARRVETLVEKLVAAALAPAAAPDFRAENAQKSLPPVAEAASGLERIWIWFADNGNIRKWQRKPFAEGTEYVVAAHAGAELDEMTRSCLAERAGRLAAEAQLAEANKALADIRREAIRCRGEQSYRNFASFAARRAHKGGTDRA